MKFFEDRKAARTERKLCDAVDVILAHLCDNDSDGVDVDVINPYTNEKLVFRVSLIDILTEDIPPTSGFQPASEMIDPNLGV